MADQKANESTAASTIDNKAENATNKAAKKNDSLNNEHGHTSIEDVVVAKIAGLAAREVSGVHALGGNAARMAGSLRTAFGGGENAQQGVNVEVGETQAAVDLSIVAEYGVAIHELSEAIRRNIIRSIERMTGLEVTEVNIDVTDVHLANDDDDAADKRQNNELSAAETNQIANQTARVQ